MRLHVNVDHVATLRQARGTDYPDPVVAARACEDAGADGITVHLREDRRHIQDHDLARLRPVVRTFLNLEMAATEEMVGIAIAHRPDLVTLVPERREERTTEGGLDVVGQRTAIASVVRRLGDAGIPVSLFVAAEPAQLEASKEVGARTVELHTGDYAHAAYAATRHGGVLDDPERGARPHELGNLGPTAAAALEHWSREVDAHVVGVARALDALVAGAAQASRLGLGVAAGHGLSVDNVGPLVARAREIEELNIGHAIVSDAVMIGLASAVRVMRAAIDAGLRERGA